jgi:hypothetical protein
MILLSFRQDLKRSEIHISTEKGFLSSFFAFYVVFSTIFILSLCGLSRQQSRRGRFIPNFGQNGLGQGRNGRTRTREFHVARLSG